MENLKTTEQLEQDYWEIEKVVNSYTEQIEEVLKEEDSEERFDKLMSYTRSAIYWKNKKEEIREILWQ